MSELGDMIVFSGDWLAYQAGPDERVRTQVGWIVRADYRYAAGFRGRLVTQWAGGIECAVTRQVAEAIVASQQQLRVAYHKRLDERHDLTAPDRRARLDHAIPRLFFVGATLTLDESALRPGDDDPFRRVHPDSDGLYNVGFGWSWGQVDPASCDQIVPA